MNKLESIENAVRQLSPEELKVFGGFDDYATAEWDRQIQHDAEAGRLDRIAEEALNDVREGRCLER